MSAIILGVGATLLMDLWNLFLKHALRIRSLDYCLLGRWIRHMPAGTFRHANISAAAAKPHECLAGYAAHYSIGVTLAAGFLLLAPDGWLARPTLLPAVAFGVVTVVFPFFVMQPALGLGVASARVQNPNAARLKSLVTHLVFGAGLYLFAILG